jgi:cell division protein FtsN
MFYTKITRIVLLVTCILVPYKTLAQDENPYDEVSVSINIAGVGSGEIPSVIKGETLYLPITDLFDFIKIKNVPSANIDSISGFFIDPKAKYLIDRIHNKIIFEGKEYNIKPGDLVRTETNLYLNSAYFGEIFGLVCKFNFRSLSVSLETKLELPVIREMKQAAMRKNISRLKGEFQADTVISRSYPLFHFGMADWSVMSTQQIKGLSETRLNLALGSIIAGGELNTSFYYNSNEPFTERQQYYRWRYVDNDLPALRQIIAGKITTQATSTLFNPVVGVQLTNAPTTYRRSFGTYTLSDNTEPGWMVELYVNNVLVDFVKADAAGFYSFDVPLVYGTSIIKLKFYGPWGEERTKEQTISIPYSFLPVKTFEYTASAGIVEDTLSSRFSRLSASYGVTSNFTVGTGVEYLSSVTSGVLMPYLNASLRLSNNLLLSGEYTYSVRSKATLTYRLPSNIQFDFNYILYNKDQKAINYPYRQERRAIISAPLRIMNKYVYNRLTINQMVLSNAKYTSAGWMISSSFFGMNTNLASYALFVGDNSPVIYSDLSLSIRLPARIVLMPQTQYSYTGGAFLSVKMKAEKKVFKDGYLSLSYEQNFKNNLQMGEVGFHYDFSFAQIASSVRRDNRNTTFTEYVRGSLINDRPTRYLGAEKNSNVGKGGISFVAYLDVNNNGKMDPGEKKLPGLNIHASSGLMERSERDTIVRVLGLEPYTKCFVDIDPYSFDRIAWRLNKQTYSVEVDPNKLKLIEIPVSVMGEANGIINRVEGKNVRGIGRIIIDFYSVDNKYIGRTITEQDGYYSYLGFKAGSYIARPDAAQLHRLKLISLPEERLFTINQDPEGDIVDNLDFSLTNSEEEKIRIDTSRADTSNIGEEQLKQKGEDDTTKMVIHEAAYNVVIAGKEEFVMQIGAFKNKANAYELQKKTSQVLDKKVEIIEEGGFYKVRVTGFESREELNDYIPVLRKNGVKEMWVVYTKAKDVVITIDKNANREVTLITEAEEISGESKNTGIQVGAFIEKRLATILRNKTRKITSYDVRVDFEDGFYKVRISGFASDNDLHDLLPTLSANDYKEIWILPANEKLEKPYNMAAIGFIIKPELVPVANAYPRFALQVGTFYRKHDANVAGRRITRLLGREAKVVKKWDYYTVIIAGFYTKLSTNDYYPKIAGLGYPAIYLIEKK